LQIVDRRSNSVEIDNGFSPDLSHRDAGADLELDLEIGLGHIEVRYADR
jgi:hypothetical protein